MKNIKIVNVPDISSGEAFVDLPSINGRPLEWDGYSGLPATALERIVRRPRLSRYRAAWQATEAAKDADLVISHLPRMTAAVEACKRIRNVKCRHFAFSFNFTDIPSGKGLYMAEKIFKGVDKFCVYSKFEVEKYSDVFCIDKEKFFPVIWTQEAPKTNMDFPVGTDRFVVAIGGEGRDYSSIVEAAKLDRNIEWRVIARPNPIFEKAPPNVKVYFNLPSDLTWGVAKRAAAVVVPLKNDETCCGHITIVSAQLLGLPVITTRSAATTEYVTSMPATFVVEPGQPASLVSAAVAALKNHEANLGVAASELDATIEKYHRSKWASHLENLMKSDL